MSSPSILKTTGAPTLVTYNPPPPFYTTLLGKQNATAKVKFEVIFIRFSCFHFCSSVKLFRNTLLWGRRVEFSALTFCTVFSIWLQVAGKFCQNWNLKFVVSKAKFQNKLNGKQYFARRDPILCNCSIVDRGIILFKESWSNIEKSFAHNLVWPFNFF